MISQIGYSLNRRWSYHASVMNVLEQIRSRTVRIASLIGTTKPLQHPEANSPEFGDCLPPELWRVRLPVLESWLRRCVDDDLRRRPQLGREPLAQLVAEHFLH